MRANLMTYLWILVVAFAVVMTLIGILRWVANTQKRGRRLTIISICSFVILVIMLLMGNWGTISGIFANSSMTNAYATSSLIHSTQTIIKVLLMVFMVTFLLISALMVILLVVCSGGVIVSAFEDKEAEKTKQKLQEKTEKITVLLKNPVIIMAIVGGILALYLTLPLAMGENTESIAKCWTDGVEQIVRFCNVNTKVEVEELAGNEVASEETTSEEVGGEESARNQVTNSTLANSLSVYSLVFILILGIAYAVGNILFEIIKDGFEKKTGFLKEYSNSIGLLAVGISMLYLISNKGIDLFKTEPSKLVVGFIESFVLVIFVIALGILTLEIVRLLMDLKEKMIRREARYIFVLLVGLCTVIIMRAFSVVYNAISSALGGKSKQLERAEERIQKVYDYIIEKVAMDMAEEIDADNKVDGEIPYNAFKGTTTKK